MGFTQKEADEIELEFMNALDEAADYSKAGARKVLAAWDHLVRTMARENNMSDRLGIDSLDWQIGNFANDTSDVAHNAHLYREVIKVNEQILQIRWSGDENLFHENAKRDIADAYADLGDFEKCFELYEKYLREDPLWGWAWIGYYRQLQGYDEDKFKSVLDDLYKKVKNHTDFRDKEDLYRELGDEYNTLGDKEKANYFYSLEDAEKHRWKEELDFKLQKLPEVKAKKIYPNDPCPCGSGKKYKKCCGRK